MENNKIDGLNRGKKSFLLPSPVFTKHRSPDLLSPAREAITLSGNGSPGPGLS